MQNQVYIFTVFILNGLIIGLLFDVFRILRKSFKTPDVITYLEDFIFWILTFLLILYSIFKFNAGEIRFYIFIAIILGISTYLLIFSKPFIKVNTIIISFIKKACVFLIIKPIKYIIKLVRKIFFKPILFISINFKKMLSKLIKNVKKIKFNNKKPKKRKDFQSSC